jgi:glyoxylase-like metal-dependent hydrolase (beta-lactamase superfamily II)/rhodanese-related sulfurtransferase
MFIKQLYTNCLSEAAYYIESEGESAIIDPIRDTQPYIDLAAERGTTIKYIFETHFHADFISGHLELSKQTGAPIIYGPETETNYPIEVAADGQEYKIGKLTLRVLHTPGHTLESTCYLLLDEGGQPHCVFTGDTLFVGDVGRPDLSSGDLGSDELAALLFNSLQKKIKTLPDHVIVYPAHGPGSSCGKNIGPDTQTTIGKEKETNYALLADKKEDFIKVVTDGLGAPPSYFSLNAKINKEGYTSLDHLLKKGLLPVDVNTLIQWKAEEKDMVILDTRRAEVFSDGFVPESIFIGLEGRYAEWAGMLLPYDKDILMVTEPGREEESLVRLTRVGFENIIGYLNGGYEAWKQSGEEFDLLINVEPDELIMDLPFDDHLVILDVRKPTEFEAGHLDDAENLPLEKLKDPGSMALVEESDNIYVHCAGGYRSTIASSLLKRQGIHNIRNVLGGYKAISELMAQEKNEQ